MMVTIAMIIATWKKQCGIAEYTRKLIEHTQNEFIKFRVFTELNDELLLAVKNEEVHFVHLQYEYSIYDYDVMYRVLMTLKNMDIPIVTTLHSWNRQLYTRNLLVSAVSSFIIVHSDEMKDQISQFRYSPEKLIVMPIGCRTLPLAPKEITKTAFHLTGYPCVGFFGFPFPHKGVRQLIAALNELKNDYPGIKGYFFSTYPDYLSEDHPYFEFLQELEPHFHQNDHLVWYRDYLPESFVVNLLHAMDVNVLPYLESEHKGTSSAVKTMLAAGSPIITTDCMYFSDLNDEVYKIPNAEPDTIAKAIRRICEDSDLHRQLVSNANSFLSNNSWDHLAERYRELYATKRRGEIRYASSDFGGRLWYSDQ